MAPTKETLFLSARQDRKSILSVVNGLGERGTEEEEDDSANEETPTDLSEGVTPPRVRDDHPMYYCFVIYVRAAGGGSVSQGRPCQPRTRLSVALSRRMNLQKSG